MEKQPEFLFPEGPVPSAELPDPRAGFYSEVAEVWHLPLGQRVRVLLKGHDLPEVSGRLELERAPDLPLNPREPMQLSAGGVAFRSTQVNSWSLID